MWITGIYRLFYTSEILCRDFRRLRGFRNEKERSANGGNGKRKCDFKSDGSFGRPGIMAVRKDSIFIGEISQDFRNARNVVLQTVIPGNHQNLGATERRHGLFVANDY